RHCYVLSLKVPFSLVLSENGPFKERIRSLMDEFGRLEIYNVSHRSRMEQQFSTLCVGYLDTNLFITRLDRFAVTEIVYKGEYFQVEALTHLAMKFPNVKAISIAATLNSFKDEKDLSSPH